MFQFNEEDLKQYDSITPSWGEVGLVTYKRTYSRPILGEDGSIVDREGWKDTCKRVIEGNMNIIENDPTATKEWALKAFDMMYHMGWLPPGRGLWMMGTDYVKTRGGDALVNCWWVSVRPQSYEDMDIFKGTYIFSDPNKEMPSFPFVFMFDRAMLGGGVGFGVNRENIEKYPMVTNSVDLKIVLNENHPDWFTQIMEAPEYNNDIDKIMSFDAPHSHVCIKVKDSREGWDIAVRELIDAHWTDNTQGTKHIAPVRLAIDMSDVRGYGTDIKGFGGTASGPLALIIALNNINKILNSRVGNLLTSTDGLDIMNLLGRCVVAGNVRRTALIAMGDADDELYINAKNFRLVLQVLELDEYGYPIWEQQEGGLSKQKRKDYNQCVSEIGKEETDRLLDLVWRQENHRWTSNNSVYTDEVFTDYHFIAAGIKANGEPGVGNTWLMKNYGRIMDGFQEAIDADVEGLNPCGEITLANCEPCNLAEVIPYICLLLGIDIWDALEIATQYTYRITFAKYMWKATQRIMDKNRRIGVSITGAQDYFLAMYGHYAVKGFEDGDITKPIFHEEIVQELNDWYKYVEFTNDMHASLLEANPSIKRTTCKPSGTIAKLPGVSSGIHFHYSAYLIQRIRFHETDPNLKVLGACGYHIEKSFKEPNTMVVSFPVKAPNADNPNFRCAKDVSLEEQFANQFLFAYAWADNAVSATLTFQPNETDKIETLLRAYGNKIKSTSLLPYAGHGYIQAPWEPITKEQYEDMVSSLTMTLEEAYKIIPMVEYVPEISESDCQGGSCPIK
jgi:ribonucleoside-triphosphate reductase